MKRGYCTECDSKNVRLQNEWTDGLGRERAECGFCNRDMNAPVQKANLSERIEKSGDPSDYMPEPVSDEPEDRDVPQDKCTYCSTPLKMGKYGPFCSPCAYAKREKLQRDWPSF